MMLPAILCTTSIALEVKRLVGDHLVEKNNQNTSRYF